MKEAVNIVRETKPRKVNIWTDSKAVWKALKSGNVTNSECLQKVRKALREVAIESDILLI